ncbi:MAG: methyl-accepting chemotaxis protein [Deferribacterales bacterium]
MSGKMNMAVQSALLIVLALIIIFSKSPLYVTIAALIVVASVIWLSYLSMKQEVSSAKDEFATFMETGEYALIDKCVLPDNVIGYLKGIDKNITQSYTGISSVADSAIPLINQLAEIKKIAEHSGYVSSQVASSGHELASAINEISEIVNETVAKAESSVDIANVGARRFEETGGKSEIMGETMNMLADNMQLLEKDASKINDVLKVINDLSDQTNMLSLNAAIEAARAGEAGRGFAVVADEVRKLAERTKHATEEIDSVVKGITGSIRSAAEMSRKTSEAVISQLEMNSEAGSSFHKVADELRFISAQINNISAALSQQIDSSNMIMENIDNLAGDSQVLDEQSNTLTDSINGLMNAVNTVESSVSPYKKGDNAALFIRAKIAHANVLRAMQIAVINKKTDMKIPDHANCMFGKAYYSAEYQEKFRNDPDYRAIEGPHKMAHKYADIVVEAVRKGDPDMLGKLKDFSSAVTEFNVVMNRMIGKLSK